MSIEFDVRNLELMENDFVMLDLNFIDILQRELHDLMVRMVDEAKSNLQNQMSVITGNLLSTIKIIKEGDLEGQVGTTEFYASYVEYGRGMVFPVKAKVLSWIDPDTAERVFAAYAGAAPKRPFLEPAVITESEDFADRVIERIAMFLEAL